LILNKSSSDAFFFGFACNSCTSVPAKELISEGLFRQGKNDLATI
jgi:hypothetical protein